MSLPYVLPSLTKFPLHINIFPLLLPVICEVVPAFTTPDDVTIYDDTFNMDKPKDALEGSGTELEITKSASSLTLVFHTVNTPKVVEVRLSVANVLRVTMKLYRKKTDNLPVVEVCENLDFLLQTIIQEDLILSYNLLKVCYTSHCLKRVAKNSLPLTLRGNTDHGSLTSWEGKGVESDGSWSELPRPPPCGQKDRRV